MTGRFNRYTTWAMCAAAAWVAAVQAQDAPTMLVAERVAKIQVVPVVADTGVARTITISGIWPGCAPVGATVTPALGFAPGTRVARMIIPQTLMPCPAAYLPYSVTTSYTPAARGIEKLLVLNDDGDFLGEALVDTRAPTDNRSAFNITGMWYDPQSNGSGLTFVHSRSNDTAVFGTWYLYDNDGKPRWFTIQNTTWSSQGRVMEGTLYQTATTGAACPMPFTACPSPSGALMLVTIGTARITLTGPNSARIEALTMSGSLMFASDIIRAEI